MTVPTESKQALAERSGDGYVTCNLGSEMHVVAISQEEKACFASILNRVSQTDKPKTGVMAMLQRRGFNAGHGLVFLSIVLVFVLGMAGFILSGKFNLEGFRLNVLSITVMSLTSLLQLPLVSSLLFPSMPLPLWLLVPCATALSPLSQLPLLLLAPSVVLCLSCLSPAPSLRRPFPSQIRKLNTRFTSNTEGY